VRFLSGKEGDNVTNETIAVRLENHEQEIKSLKHRMTEQEEKTESLTELTTSVKTLAVNMEYMAKEQEKQGERLEKLEHEPTDDFKYYKRLIIGCILTGVVSLVLGAVLAKVII
jgi:hypothetical protein